MKYKNFEALQRRRFRLTLLTYVIVGLVVLGYFCTTLWQERAHAEDGWDSYLADAPEQAALAGQMSATATEVRVGTYVENLREINLKSSYFRVEFLVWFNWQGDAALNPAGNFRVYKGVVNSSQLQKEVHNGDEHYQLVAMDVSVSKNYDTRRFPLDAHQMRFYVESTRPIGEVVFTPDYAASGMNPNLTITGYEFVRSAIGATSFMYESAHGDPGVSGPEVTSELVTAFEITRSSLGMYFKCFIALVGTITWVLIALFICTYHHVDPLGMIPGALFGTVSNIMIGANLLPDALEMGLLEYVNLWGVISILGVTIAIININQVRKKTKSPEFAHYYGTMLFYVNLVFAVAGQILLPLSAYSW